MWSTAKVLRGIYWRPPGFPDLLSALRTTARMLPPSRAGDRSTAKMLPPSSGSSDNSRPKGGQRNGFGFPGGLRLPLPKNFPMPSWITDASMQTNKMYSAAQCCMLFLCNRRNADGIGVKDLDVAHRFAKDRSTVPRGSVPTGLQG